MKERVFKQTVVTIILGIMLFFNSVGHAGNIDPYDDDSQYAYGENVGWHNFEPLEGPGVTVSDTDLTGYVWQENIGWINLSPASYGGITNDGDGNLSGYAWGENVGWINFNPNYGGVTIDSNGDFTGWAWGENIGWIHLKNDTPVAYKVQTEWLGAATPIPTLTEWGMIIFMTIIMGVGVVVLYRRRIV